MDYLEPFYQPRSESEIGQQPLMPNEWANTQAALCLAANLLHSRRGELVALEGRLNRVARKNNHGNVATLMGKKLVLAALASGIEQMHAEIELRMQTLTDEVERRLQALQLHYEQIEAQGNQMFIHLRIGEEITTATDRMQKSFTEVEAIRDHLLELGYPFDETSYYACQAKISKVLRLPSHAHLQLIPQIVDWLTQQAQQSAEGEAIELTIKAPEGIKLDSLLGEYIS